YDALAQAPWAGTGEYYRQDGQETWVKTTAPAAAVTLEERVFDCTKYTALSTKSEAGDSHIVRKVVGVTFNVPSYDAVALYAKVPASTTVGQVLGQQVGGNDKYDCAVGAVARILGTDVKDEAAMDKLTDHLGYNQDSGTMISGMLMTLDEQGKPYKYAEVPAETAINDLPEGSIALLKENEDMLNAVVMEKGVGYGYKDGDYKTWSQEQMQSAWAGAVLVPSDSETAKLQVEREITLIQSSQTSLFKNTPSFYMFTDTTFEGGKSRSDSMDGYAAVESGLQSKGAVSLKTLNGMFGGDKVIVAMGQDPYGFAAFLQNVNTMGADSFTNYVSGLNGTFGKENVTAAFVKSPVNFVTALGNMYVKCGEDCANCSTVITGLSGLFGKEAVSAAFAEQPLGFSTLVNSIRYGGKDGLADFKSGVSVLSSSDLFTEDALNQVFKEDPAGLISALDMVFAIGSEKDLKNAVNYLVGIVGDRDAVIKAFISDSEGFMDGLYMLNQNSSEQYTRKNQGVGMQNLCALIGKDTVVRTFEDSPYSVILCLSSGALTLKDIEGCRASMEMLNSMFGSDKVTEAFENNPYSFIAALNEAESAELAVREAYSVLSGLTGKKGVLNAFEHDPSGVISSLRLVDFLGKEAVELVADWFGRDKFAAAYGENASGFSSFLTAVAILGIGDFIGILDELAGEYGKDEVSDTLMSSSGWMHLGRLMPDTRDKDTSASWLKEALNDRFAARSDERPLAVVIMPTTDWNHVFDSFPAYADIRGTYRVMYYETDNEDQAFEYIEDATKDEQSSLLLLGGHGLQTGLYWGEGNSDDDYLGLADEVQIAFLKDDVKNDVILESCSTGKGREEQANLANMLYRVCGCDVYAPSQISSAPTVSVSGEGGETRVAAVNFGYYLDTVVETYHALPDSGSFTGFNQAIAADARNDDPWTNKGTVLVDSGKYQTAITSLDKAIALDSKPTADRWRW
ncbi:MAG: hypothetical protein PHG46_02555, partial [Candidatus Omnitrophica bacterium]|nr:hypothetical protein [Candidatus Omnitrophota bacterium]